MSELSYLESLNNAELRAKCLEYGLPNVPVTNTSRKLLIRRLQKALDATPTTTQTTNRRTTLQRHVIAPTDNEATVSNCITRRTTASVSPRRRKQQEEAHLTKPQQKIHIVPITIESRRSNVENVQVKQTTPLQTNTRPQLSTSGLLTTSYIQEIQPLPELVHGEDDVDVEDDGDEDNDNYDDNEEEPEDNVDYTRHNGSNNLNRTHLAGIAQNLKRPEIHYVPQVHRNGYISNNATIYAEPEPEEEPYSNAQQAHRSDYRYGRNIAATYAAQETEEDVNTLTAQAPYFSEFTRNLERLKTIPLAVDGPRYVHARANQPNYSEPVVRDIDEDSIEVPLRELCNVLERKYHIKQSLILFLVFCTIVFLYVFLTSSPYP